MTNQLGCASNYTVKVSWARPDDNFYMTIDRISKVTWSRALDDVSVASVEVPKNLFTNECCTKLDRVEPWVFTIAVYRDDVLVWLGPITRVLHSSEDDLLFIEAADIIAYLDKSTPQITESLSMPMNNYIDRLLESSWSALSPSPDPWKIRAEAYYDIGALTATRDVVARTFFVGEELRDLARGGIDFTTVGRQLVVVKEKTRSEYTGTFFHLVAGDFSNGLQIVYLGADTANRAAMTAADGSWTVTATNDSSVNAYGPLWSIEDPGRFTSSTDGQTVVNSVVRQRGITPRGIVIPQDSSLLPTTNIGINDLICGTRIDVYAPYGCSEFGDAMKLVHVDVSFSSDNDDGETVNISLVSIPEDPV